ncbi:hypothetical protein DFR75_104472 [Nocardia ignorata]|uniref:Uncharacterized protein n=1 Tax=Nocardia ignorata TaxID=145285 RepID=A0A4R6PMT4_NOCIG|nr:hypothetical protein DFR75_104472 [Nocardia ignorata]
MSHVLRARDGPQCRALDPTAIADENDLGGEDVQQGLGSPEVRARRNDSSAAPGFVGRDRHSGAAGIDVSAGAVGGLADGGGSLADGGGDIVVADLEHLAKHEYRAFGR